MHQRKLTADIQRLFVLAQDYAAVAGRSTPFAGDLARAQAESGWDVGRLKREAKKRRIGMSTEGAECRDSARSENYMPWPRTAATLDVERLSLTPALALPTEPAPPEPPQPLTLASLPELGSDEKPRPTPAPAYAFDHAPPLPQPWTYAPDEVPPPPPPPNKVTSGVLDFIKLTATERGDIPPELGLVDYRRREGKRKWGTRGAGA